MARPKMSDAQRQMMQKQITDTAKSLFYDAGIEAVSIRNIARKIGVGATTIYTYFKSSNEILSSIWWQVVYKLEAQMAQAIADVPLPADRLAILMRTYAEFAWSNEEEFRITFLTPDIPSETVVNMAPDPLDRPGFVLTFTAVKDGIADGSLTSDDPLLAAQIVWTSIHGAISTPRLVKGFQWLPHEQLVEATIEMALRSLKVTR
jgi:AcrR family transcriptional regulator